MSIKGVRLRGVPDTLICDVCGVSNEGENPDGVAPIELIIELNQVLSSMNPYDLAQKLVELEGSGVLPTNIVERLKETQWGINHAALCREDQDKAAEIPRENWELIQKYSILASWDLTGSKDYFVRLASSDERDKDLLKLEEEVHRVHEEDSEQHRLKKAHAMSTQKD